MRPFSLVPGQVICSGILYQQSRRGRKRPCFALRASIGALPLYTPHTRRRGAREQVAASGLNLPLPLKAGVTLRPSRAVSLDRSPVSSLRCGPLHATVRP